MVASSSLPTSAFRWWAVAVLAGLLVLLGLAERELHRRRALTAFPPAGAAWIWSAEAMNGGGPSDFLMVGDFALDQRPEVAEVLVAADELYQLHLNGRWVGAGRYTGSLHSYALAEWLRPGGNRVVVELSSSRGAGGFLFCLRLGGEDCAFVSGAAWRAAERWEPGILAGWWPINRGSAPGVWGLAPLGRWPLAPIEPRPSLTSCLVESPVAAELEPGSDPPRFVIDPVRQGFLEVTVVPEERLRTAAFWAGPAPPSNGEVAQPLLLGPHAERWRSAAPVTAGVVAVSGLSGIRRVQSIPLRDRSCFEAFASEVPPEVGLLGLSPSSGTPMEDELRGEP